jgi:hypothetical protein
MPRTSRCRCGTAATSRCSDSWPTFFEFAHRGDAAHMMQTDHLCCLCSRCDSVTLGRIVGQPTAHGWIRIRADACRRELTGLLPWFCTASALICFTKPFYPSGAGLLLARHFAPKSRFLSPGRRGVKEQWTVASNPTSDSYFGRCCRNKRLQQGAEGSRLPGGVA